MNTYFLGTCVVKEEVVFKPPAVGKARTIFMVVSQDLALLALVLVIKEGEALQLFWQVFLLSSFCIVFVSMAVLVAFSIT